MKRTTITGLENYFGPIPTAFNIESPYGAEHYYISPWWVLSLDSYLRDNLIQLLLFINSNHPIINAFNTGDWVAILLAALAKPMLDGTRVVPRYSLDTYDHPNLSTDTIKWNMIVNLATRIKDVDNCPIEEAIEKAKRYLDA